MTDFTLHFIVSVLIYFIVYKFIGRHDYAIMATMMIGLTKEFIDSLTHYAELIDLFGDFAGIMAIWFYYMTKEGY